MLLIKNGTINDSVTRYPYRADVLINGDRLEKVSPNIAAPVGTPVYDATGLNIYAGFIDASCETGLSSVLDTNFSDIRVRALDMVDPLDSSQHMAVAQGVASACAGVLNNGGKCLCGTSVLYGLAGACIDEMVIKEPIAMECVISDETLAYDAAEIRAAIMKSRDYLQRITASAKPPAKKGEEPSIDYLRRPPLDSRLEAVLPVLEHKLAIRFHVSSPVGLYTAIRVAGEFGLTALYEYSGGLHPFADNDRTNDAVLQLCPGQGDGKWTLPEYLERHGIVFSLVSGMLGKSGRGGLKDVAILACEGGLEPFAVLRAITIVPARQLGVAGQLGTIEEGKLASLTLVEGDLVSRVSRVRAVFWAGEQVL